MVVALALLACVENRLEPTSSTSTTTNTELGADDAVEVAVGSAFDPMYGALAIAVTTWRDATDVEVEVRDGDGRVVFADDGTTDDDGRLDLEWDGRDDGAFVDVGEYTVVATIAGDEDDADVVVVRAGFVAAWLEGDEGISATREPLYWPIERELQDEGDPVAVLDAIDDGAEPADFEDVPLTPARPNNAEPAAFVYDSRPLLVLEVASASGLGGTALDVATVDVSAEGWTVLSGSPLRPGDEVVLQLDAPLGDSVGVSALDVELVFSVDDLPIGRQQLPLRVYRVLDVSQYTSDAPKYRPWAPVLEQSLSSIDGTPPDVNDVLDALVGFVYFDLELVYDTQAGASAYSLYENFDWDSPHFFLSDFLARRNGDVINCSDAGNILGVYANMVGAPLDHLIIDPGFELNYIRAIGHAEHTSCPFGQFGCGFSYHAVTTVRDSGLIWDATLALDGDGNPGAEPNTDLMVQSITGDEYLDRLVRSGNPNYNSESQGTFE